MINPILNSYDPLYVATVGRINSYKRRTSGLEAIQEWESSPPMKERLVFAQCATIDRECRESQDFGQNALMTQYDSLGNYINSLVIKVNVIC